ncbi:MAG: hypothetical protein J3K34DRAFT_131660 [Monoraphidium minutum]|nr:MAG: hypothetical protein J3K34DRAFT_131660 [Monoraphidium minutum]
MKPVSRLFAAAPSLMHSVDRACKRDPFCCLAGRMFHWREHSSHFDRNCYLFCALYIYAAWRVVLGEAVAGGVCTGRGGGGVGAKNSGRGRGEGRGCEGIVGGPLFVHGQSFRLPWGGWVGGAGVRRATGGARPHTRRGRARAATARKGNSKGRRRGAALPRALNPFLNGPGGWGRFSGWGMGLGRVAHAHRTSSLAPPAQSGRRRPRIAYVHSLFNTAPPPLGASARRPGSRGLPWQ